MIQIRSLTEADIEVLPGLALEDWKETWEGYLAEADIETFVAGAYDPERLKEMLPAIAGGKMGFWIAEEDGKIAGWLQVADFGAGMEIGRSAFQGDEVSEALLEAAESFLKGKGIPKYFSFVDEDDRDYKMTLESYGFKHIRKKDDGTDRYLEKELS